jgi:hypothetical protein
MARVLVVSDDGTATVEMGSDDVNGAYGRCLSCGELIWHRGHFEDTVEASGLHIDQRH